MSFGGGDIFSRIETLLKMFHEINKKLVNTVHIDFAISREQVLMVYPLLEALDKIKFNYISNSYDLSSSIARAYTSCLLSMLSPRFTLQYSFIYYVKTRPQIKMIRIS